MSAVLDDYLDGLLVPETPAAAAPLASVPAAAAPEAGAAPIAQAPAEVAQEPAPVAGPATAAPAAIAPVPPPAAMPVPPRPAPPPAPVARPMPFQVQDVAQRMSQPSGSDHDEALVPPHRRAADRASRWLRLRCAGQAYGLELLKVQEVVLPTPLLPLRGTPPAMLGVMNLRGQVVPVMDLGVYLGQPAQPPTAATRIVVLEEKGETLGLRVTAVDDVANLTDQQIEPPDNARVGRIHNALFRGIARLAAEPMILLDASCLLVPPASRRDAA